MTDVIDNIANYFPYFRAVNQALGRCLRHINDWGAIIMIESRLPGNDRYWNGISRWIRDEMIATDNCAEAMERLEYFCHDKRGMLGEYDINSGEFNDSAVSVIELSLIHI